MVMLEFSTLIACPVLPQDTFNKPPPVIVQLADDSNPNNPLSMLYPIKWVPPEVLIIKPSISLCIGGNKLYPEFNRVVFNINSVFVDGV